MKSAPLSVLVALAMEGLCGLCRRLGRHVQPFTMRVAFGLGQALKLDNYRMISVQIKDVDMSMAGSTDGESVDVGSHFWMAGGPASWTALVSEAHTLPGCFRNRFFFLNSCLGLASFMKHDGLSRLGLIQRGTAPLQAHMHQCTVYEPWLHTGICKSKLTI